jgi:hypothetical protein
MEYRPKSIIHDHVSGGIGNESGESTYICIVDCLIHRDMIFSCRIWYTSGEHGVSLVLAATQEHIALSVFMGSVRLATDECRQKPISQLLQPLETQT